MKICKECIYYKRIPMSKDKGQCFYLPPVPVLLADKTGVPVTASIRPQVMENDYCHYNNVSNE